MPSKYIPTPKPVATITNPWVGCYVLRVSIVGRPLIVRKSRFTTLHAARESAHQQYPRATVVIVPDAPY